LVIDPSVTDSPPVPAPVAAARPNWARAGVKVIPYVGEALDELVFGRLDEVRWNRLEQSIRELGEIMKEREIPADEVQKEEFGRLLEEVAPSIASTTSDEKRRFLRDLLVNAVSLPAKDPKWESARVAADMIAKLEDPALELLAAFVRLDARGKQFAELWRPVGGKGPILALVGAAKSIEFAYDWFVMDQAYRQLTETSARRLVISGAQGSTKYEHLALTPLGEFVVDWAASDSK
jgi:hypothetical protein